ncbi:CsbD family protein [Kitasatospora camelliae]|uniref:CsbD family protein n=1 Tax=Kitasatospora camelliae TaxID=3156397 RepID=A0AAU8JR05_9ACTN
MTARKKAKHTATVVKGRAEEALGKTVGNERLIAKGKADRIKGDLAQAGQKAKDAFKH